MNSQTHFNFARAARDKGMASVMHNTPGYFQKAVWDAVSQLARSGRQFTAEDVRLITGDPPNHPNAMGANIFACVRAGIIKRVGFTKANRRLSHARVVQIYVGTNQKKAI